MTRYYVTGGTGFVGSNIVGLLTRQGHDVMVPVNSFRPGDEVPYAHERVDLHDPVAARASVEAFEPDVVIHSAILNDHAAMAADPDLAWAAYVGTTDTLARSSGELGAHFVLVSTDWVFDGRRGGYRETDAPNPIQQYGMLKMASELVALGHGDHTAVGRVSGVNGVHWARPETPRHQDAGFGYFVASIVDALETGATYDVWESDHINQVATPSLATESAEMIRRIAERRLHGIFHCCGGEAVTRRQLAELACDVFDLDPSLLRFTPPDPMVEATGTAPRDVSLDATATAAAIDYTLPTARQLVDGFRHQRQTGQIALLAP